MRVSRTTVGVRQPLDQRPGDARAHRRHEVEPVRGEARREDRHLDDDRVPAAQARDLLDHLAVGQDVGAADVVALAERVGAAADAVEVRDDVGQRDRLRRRRDPARRDHRGQPVDQRDDRLERGAAAADDDGGAQRRHRHRPGGERLGGLDAAAEVLGQAGPVVAEPAEVDDLGHAGALGLAGDGLGGAAVDVGEVGRAERVDEVVDDLGAVERGAQGARVGDVRPNLAHARLLGPAVPRHGHDLGTLRQHRHERAADEAGRAEHRDPHRRASRSHARK